MDNKITEFFTYNLLEEVNWFEIINHQMCQYTSKKCIKTRKSQANISIGTCTLSYQNRNIIICPFRLLERKQIFIDCLHLLKGHVPGNELHIIPEVSVPGGSVDYFLVSCNQDRKIIDFVGIELQTLDTTGTVWPERQKLLKLLNIELQDESIENKSFGMNWKMTAKTILIQIHHKIETFEHLNKNLVLVIQDRLLEYLEKEFNISNNTNDATLNDSMHIHSYKLGEIQNKYKLFLDKRLSTDSIGIANTLGLKSEAKIELQHLLKKIEIKISDNTMLSL
ncbi:NotI family restriction endonuclease [Chryseobacterium jejuense]|uniref:Restriction endonuclease NotI n=1 Tax=Chryseobacterium jejuense TaxID=445960 RepID=A0A2X2VDP4_CHRJE|nr:NotI family restriction endonuclease [Chryseobacterium jejuense]SDI24537.1 Restriction endonuclease NotI [Chryseobacterium jejuense]SQB26668.1 Restriction endonuclease NotI [Chryseobacterium jejuense]